MLNDRSSILSLLETRRSEKPRDMVEPGPSDDELERILTIAARTPDHGKLNPWRFVVIARDQRNALANVLVDALAAEEPDAPSAKKQKARDFAHNAGALVVLLSAPVQGHKIPVWDQELSCGAAAMNLLLAAQALGYVGGWVTGWAAYSPLVSAAFCAPGERIAGFIFLASLARELDDRPRPALAEVVGKWRTPTH
jgi:nitroreductase